ncbi:MAG: hypothetical protein LBR80_04405 [Deltaproteobacteria bacterium]|jgi:hypothetical protein|nr:hypothetical protein [Deltaproteobacteria bacterium]
MLSDAVHVDGRDMDRNAPVVFRVFLRQHRGLFEEPEDIGRVGGGLELENEDGAVALPADAVGTLYLHA